MPYWVMNLLILAMYILAIFFLPWFIYRKLWANFGHKLTRRILLKNIERYNNKKSTSWYSKLISLKFNQEYKYYIEAEVEDLDLNKIWILFKKKIFYFVFTSIGFSFTIAYIMVSLIGWEFFADEYRLTLIIYIGGGLLSLGPVMLFWLIPLIWTVENLKIRSIDNMNIINFLEKEIKKSYLEKFIGVAGLVSAHSLLLKFSEFSISINPTTGIPIISDIFKLDDSTLAILMTKFLLFITIFFYFGISFLLCITYLNKHHESFVNNLRYEISKLLPIGITSVRKSIVDLSPSSDNSGKITS